MNMVGRDKANAIFSGAIHLLSAGSSDFIQNYYINPILNTAYSPDQFSDIVLRSYSTFIQVSLQSQFFYFSLSFYRLIMAWQVLFMVYRVIERKIICNQLKSANLNKKIN